MTSNLSMHQNTKHINEQRHDKNLLLPNANNKAADQPGHRRSLDSTIPLLTVYEISTPKLVSSAEQALLSITLVGNPEDRFSRDAAQIKIQQMKQVPDSKPNNKRLEQQKSNRLASVGPTKDRSSSPNQISWKCLGRSHH